MVSSSTSILVVGAGVLGLCTAVELTRRGHAVTVVDPGAANASSVAAGMIAPAFESVLEDASQARADLLRAARDLWPAFARQYRIALSQAGAEWRGAEAPELADRLRHLNFDAQLSADAGTVTTEDDWQIEPRAALARLAEVLGERVLLAALDWLERTEGGWRATVGGRVLTAQTVVLATGTASAPVGVSETTQELVASVQPIRGQIGIVSGSPVTTVRRLRGAYLAPMGDRTVLGASMEADRRDLAPDAASAAMLLETAQTLSDRPIDPDRIDWRVGVRGATADGLPMAGPAGEAGLHLALAPRRNGWLLGPLVGTTVADGIEGQEPGAWGAALDPRRFLSSAG